MGKKKDVVIGSAVAIVIAVFFATGPPWWWNDVGLTKASSQASSSSASDSSSHSSRSSSSSSGAVSGRSLGPELTAQQLENIVSPVSTYEAVARESLGTDTTSYALHGGISSLKLCNGNTPAQGIGAEYSAAFAAPSDYFGSDAASFAGQGAKQFMTMAADGSSCWRRLRGPTLDDQVLRLTTDQQSVEHLHEDVILVRSGAAVLEVGTATTRGSHSADAEGLAETEARALAKAEHRGTK